MADLFKSPILNVRNQKKSQNEYLCLSPLRSCPIWLHMTSEVINLYGFCDTSELAYSAAIYRYQPDGNDHPFSIMVAKTEVPLVNQISICYLELLGALLLTRLFCCCFLSVIRLQHFLLCLDRLVSGITLESFSSSKMEVVVKNGTSEILDIIPYELWSHVPSKRKLVVLASKGVNPEDLVSNFCYL
ncbi:hypothetical protein TNCT_213741 [Trichonephila clavata]|uniref:Uncharacterized protein n=1 Tax=Trichonephila clavata TaxID=2740835 RepID=A0A8X6FH70_TRICU|nr:hypothetical protein TNCT_213741 [Trichonephila clavata]